MAACFYSSLAHLHARAGLPPVTTSPTVTTGTHLSGPSSPKSSSALCPCVVVGELLTAEPSTCQFLLTTMPPHMRLHPGAVTSSLMQHGVLSMLRLLSALLLVVPLGWRCQPLDDEALEQPTSLTELPVSKAHRLDQGVAFLHALRRSALAPVFAPRCHPMLPFLSSSPVLMAYGQTPSASPPRKAAATMLLPLRLAAHACTPRHSAALSRHLSLSLLCVGPHCPHPMRG
jgi:hypothetical protein